MEERMLNSESEDEPEGLPKKSEVPPEEVIPPWDAAKQYVPGSESEDVNADHCYITILKTLKILSYIVTFVLALAGAVLSKSTLLLMTSQIKPDRRVLYCSGLGRQLEVEIPELERISWTWAIFFSFMVPELLGFIRSIRVWLFKATLTPTLFQFIVPFFFETCHTLGLSLFAFIVLPSMNVMRGAMLTNAVCFIPAIFSFLSRTPVPDPKDPKNDGSLKAILQMTLDGVALIFLIIGITIWPVLNHEPSGRSWLLPLTCLLISCGWWENYADRASRIAPLRWLGRLNLGPSRFVTYFYLSLWKMAVFCGGMALSYSILDFNVSNLFHDFVDAFEPHNLDMTEIRPPITNGSSIPGDQFYGNVLTKLNVSSAVQYALMTQILATFLTYLTGKFACKIGIQGFSFAFPLNLAVPATLVFLVSMCGFRDENTCFWTKNFFPPYLAWECPKGDMWKDFMGKEHGWVWLLFILAQTWVTIHIWNPKFRRLERAEILFVNPTYNALLIDQSLTLNRRRKITDYVLDFDEHEEEESSDQNSYQGVNNVEPTFLDGDTIPKIYACATMWHEIKDEMMEMLKSVFRMDLDQCERRIARKQFEVNDPDYYEYETHIFFDDAFSKAVPYVCNSYVKDMIVTLERAASAVHNMDVKLRPPKKIPTPYGGRLEWVLPGRTILTVHMKNKNKIRHKKRWSQVMYMYYLLGYKLLDRDIPVARKEVIADNTFILALDGDIDFKPKAVQLLVDLMKKNKNLGAACGRIHPIGSSAGLMVWYQKFEYAIGHWFQKATEHVIGCVLCSPGCFSLFRGKTLLDDNVMAKYTLESSEPKHYVQYDQGEDRWLCTLILQQGYRVEYSAASDSLTHCPEGFNEFFNQRRRWVPSTMANIFDVLMDYKRTIRMNPDISMPYIAYQMLMMVGSILGPGSIFLMLIGAFNAAFRIPNVTCFIWNFIPVFLFILCCFFFDSKIQLIFAQILAAAYALVMVAVVVALMMQIQEDGPLAPSSLFLFGVAASFIIAAMLHPLEFGCLPYGLVYYITIPSMYLILIIYSLMNMHDVSWGTRDAAPEAGNPVDAAKQAEELKKQQEEAKKGGLLGFLTSKLVDDTEGSFEFSCAGLFKLMCCTKPVDKSHQLATIAVSLMEVNKRLDSIERGQANNGATGSERRFSVASNAAVNPVIVVGPHSGSVLHPVGEERPGEYGDEGIYGSEVSNVKREPERNDDVNPYWIDDLDQTVVSDGVVDFLSGAELTFWRELIKKYLKPIDADPAKEKKLKKDLINLRNQMMFFFFMINAVFVLAIFLLQNNKETLHFDWPFGAKVNMTYIEGTEIQMQKNSLQLEPIGIVFVAVFAVIIGIQFVAMLFHRFGTFCHILASTIIEFCTRDVHSIAKEAAFDKDGLEFVRRLGRLKSRDDGGVRRRKTKATVQDVARRKTIHNLEKRQTSTKKPLEIERNFNKVFNDANKSPEDAARILADAGVGANPNKRQTFQQFQKRRSSVLERRQSVVVERRKSVVGSPDGVVQRNSVAFPYQRPRSGVDFTNQAFDPNEA